MYGRKLGLEQRTCKQCGHVVQSKAKLRLGLCPSCYEHQVIMNQLNVEFKNFKSTCIMEMYADYVDSKRWISLSDATKLTIKHRAAADCFAVLELLQQLKNKQLD
ncbi:hypothetical protein COL41_25915 [Bacillus mycoides]|nr:hypothetical protein COL41_25915 [Bacillus mycoides]QWG59555.1 hypothetical protein EXW60_00030 [Bacillus mycoides]QWG90682.1 hypothetical protein EXW40_16690 [Bacillus mycoides]QWH79253.1 hypothetical protein EXW59_22250 [Bacillus mycoides]QWI44302.1 hypothetical protein EXW55_15505 [Bacillus mycoides]